jgi:hypothetical protein
VYQYSYKRVDKEGKEREWVVLWDYNIGLVKITPFFKSLGHSKVSRRTC